MDQGHCKGTPLSDCSYAVLEGPSPRYTGPLHSPARDAGSHVAHCLPESEVGSWQNTVPASVEDQLLLQLNELSVREICLQDLKWVFIDIDIHLVLGRGLIFVGYWR